MPIYAYKCESCGHAKDFLQKMSDDPLTVCPACGKSALIKQVTAAGFQLKGSGWYVTDFRGGANAGGKDTQPVEATPSSEVAPAAGPSATVADTPASSKAAAAAAAPSPSPSPSPAPSASPTTSSSSS